MRLAFRPEFPVQDSADKYEAVGYDLPLTPLRLNSGSPWESQEQLEFPDSPSYVERKLQDIYTASVQLAEVSGRLVQKILVKVVCQQLPNVARRFEGALSSMSKDVEEDPIEDATFQEAMSAYTIHGRCQMEILLAEVLDTLPFGAAQNEDAMGGTATAKRK
ncbi:hypothetical protein AK812_SmicGene3799 [Symbiodinium microadriaticum]|uniref:Uncharacterized protein n=1 Tax=Symbiodinium microadriaticum TaxID=2951 RepID=A0A1Q9EY52_SYMMI|nr:hypothetical protein AK812_SmicGene3799 [Symbiodinium microadriaticum]